MTKLSVFIESKAGEVLAEVISFKDKITIGSSEECSICLKNIKIAELESEIYFLNGECWLQVSKEGAPVSTQGKQHRSIKITQSTQFQFRDVVMKVILDSIPEFESEATKIVNQTMMDSSEKTRVVAGEDAHLLMESTRIVDKDVDIKTQPSMMMEDAEATRVVAPDEATRVVIPQEATRVVSLNEETVTSTFIKNSFKKEPKTQKVQTQLDTEKSSFDFQSYIDSVEVFLEQFQLRERIFPILGVVFVIIAVIMISSREENTAPGSSVAATKEPTNKELPSAQPAHHAGLKSPSVEPVTTTTKEQYLREMSSLFE